MKTNPTHYLVIHSGVEVLYEAETGIRIAFHEGECVMFGREPNRGKARVFRTWADGARWIREQAAIEEALDFGAPLPRAPVLEEIQTEGLVKLAEGSVHIAKPGDMRTVGGRLV